MNLKHQILGTTFERVLEPINVPHWPGTEGKLFMRNLNALEAEQYGDFVTGHNLPQGTCVAAAVTSLVLVDADGKQVFSGEDTAALSQLDESPLAFVFDRFVAWWKVRRETQKKQFAELTGKPGTTSPGNAVSSTQTT
jgi:hypothetical protein